MTAHAPSRRVTASVGSLPTGTRRLARDALRRDPDDRWAAAFGLIAGYSFAVAAVTGILLLPFFRPSMASVVYHGSYAELDGVPVSQAFRSVLAIRCPREARCRHGYPAGVIPIPGDRHPAGPAGPLFFATRAAAEGDLRRTERQRAARAAREASFIKELRRAMADAHPDHGGTAGQFIQARRRYQTALQQA
ncbi:MAG: hypothetical protein ACRDN0_09735 [Trebonia sp.]